MSKAEFAKLAPDLQATLKTTAQKYSAKLIEAIRADNAKSVATLKNNGIQVVAVSPTDRAEIEKASMDVRPKLVGKLYSQDLLNKVQGYLDEYRKTHASN
jgi:TRAP-type C4-dicarboxylate transport system substrate-binding protein